MCSLFNNGDQVSGVLRKGNQARAIKKERDWPRGSKGGSPDKKKGGKQGEPKRKSGRQWIPLVVYSSTRCFNIFAHPLGEIKDVVK